MQISVRDTGLKVLANSTHPTLIREQAEPDSWEWLPQYRGRFHRQASLAFDLKRQYTIGWRLGIARMISRCLVFRDAKPGGPPPAAVRRTVDRSSWTPDDATVLRREVERNWSDLPPTRRMLGVDLDGSSRIWPAHVDGLSV